MPVMNTDTPQRLAAALGAAALTIAAILGLGMTAAPPAHAICGGGGGFHPGGGCFTGDDNGNHLGQIKNGSTPGDNGNHTGEPSH